MNKILLFIALLTITVANAQKPVSRPSVVVRPSYDSSSSSSVDVEEEPRFEALENIGGSGFYWLDTTNGELWRMDSSVTEWEFLGAPRGSNPARKGTYQLLSDRRGGVYILHTDKGEGWWTDGTDWKIFGEPSSRVKKTE